MAPFVGGAAAQLAPRADLGSSAVERQTYAMSVSMLVVASLSMLSSGWIILSFLCIPTLRSFRHQLILGLAIGDFLRATNTIISASIDLAAGDLGAPDMKTFCAANGFINQVLVVQQDYWVLLIAVCTYILLTNKPRASAWVQSHQIIIVPLPWLLSIVWAWVGLDVSGGFGNFGSLCWFVDDKARLLVNFVPRWTIILIIAVLYIRVYLLLRHSARSAAKNPDNPSTTASDLKSTGRSYFNGDARNARGDARLRRTARMMIQYPLGYILIWVLPTCVRIYHTATGRTAPAGLLVADMCCVVVSGLVNAITYGVNEAAMTSWHKFARRKSYHPPDPANRPNSILLKPRVSVSSSRPGTKSSRASESRDGHVSFGGVVEHYPRRSLGDGPSVELSDLHPSRPKPSVPRPTQQISELAPFPEEHPQSWD